MFQIKKKVVFVIQVVFLTQNTCESNTVSNLNRLKLKNY